MSKWERGETYPDITLLQPLAFHFGVTLDELMKAEGMKQHAADKKRKGRARASEKTMDKTAGNESPGALEKENPMVKKGKPPVM